MLVLWITLALIVNAQICSSKRTDVTKLLPTVREAISNIALDDETITQNLGIIKQEVFVSIQDAIPNFENIIKATNDISKQIFQLIESIDHVNKKASSSDLYINIPDKLEKAIYSDLAKLSKEIGKLAQPKVIKQIKNISGNYFTYLNIDLGPYQEYSEEMRIYNMQGALLEIQNATLSLAAHLKTLDISLGTNYKALTTGSFLGVYMTSALGTGLHSLALDFNEIADEVGDLLQQYMGIVNQPIGSTNIATQQEYKTIFRIFNDFIGKVYKTMKKVSNTAFHLQTHLESLT